MGPEDPSDVKKKFQKFRFSQSIGNCKTIPFIGRKGLFEVRPLFSLFLMRNPKKKVVTEAIFPTIWGYICIEKWSQIFVLGIGSAHSESEEKPPFQLKKWLFLTFWMGTSNARNKNLRPLFNTNIPPISGKYGLRNHFWSLESGFLMRKREENDFFSKICNNSILRFTYLKSAQNFWLFCISTFFGLLQAR